MCLVMTSFFSKHGLLHTLFTFRYNQYIIYNNKRVCAYVVAIITVVRLVIVFIAPISSEFDYFCRFKNFFVFFKKL